MFAWSERVHFSLHSLKSKTVFFLSSLSSSSIAHESSHTITFDAVRALTQRHTNRRRTNDDEHRRPECNKSTLNCWEFDLCMIRVLQFLFKRFQFCCVPARSHTHMLDTRTQDCECARMLLSLYISVRVWCTLRVVLFSHVVRHRLLHFRIQSIVRSFFRSFES